MPHERSHNIIRLDMAEQNSDASSCSWANITEHFRYWELFLSVLHWHCHTFLLLHHINIFIFRLQYFTFLFYLLPFPFSYHNHYNISLIYFLFSIQAVHTLRMWENNYPLKQQLSLEFWTIINVHHATYKQR